MKSLLPGLLGLLSCVNYLAAQAPGTGLTADYVAAHRELWPKQVITKSALQVTVNSGGAPKVMTLPAGELVNVVSVDGASVHVRFAGADFAIPAAQTDLLAGAAAAQARLFRGVSLPPAGSAQAPANAPPPAAAPAASSAPRENPLAKFLGDSLVAFRSDSIVPQPSTALAGKKFIALYFAARSSPECGDFTAKLKNFYREHRVDSRKFEIVLVPTDRSAAEVAYELREAEMPWLAVDYARQEIVGGLRKQFGGNSIPALVVIDDSGREVIGNAGGAEKAMNDFGDLLDRS